MNVPTPAPLGPVLLVPVQCRRAVLSLPAVRNPTRGEAQAKSEARPPRHGEPLRVRRGCRPGPRRRVARHVGYRQRPCPAGPGGATAMSKRLSGPAMHPSTDRCERHSCYAVTAILAGRDAYRRPGTKPRWKSMDAAPGKGNIERRDWCADHSSCPLLRPDTCRRSVGGAVGRQSWISDILFSPTAPRC